LPGLVPGNFFAGFRKKIGRVAQKEEGATDRHIGCAQMVGQARGEGGRMTGRPVKAPLPYLFLRLVPEAEPTITTW
jgi:hypothetical protein